MGSNFAPCAALGFTDKTAYPENFWVPNPFANAGYNCGDCTTIRGLQYQDDNANNNYNALQIDLRKAYSHGLDFRRQLHLEPRCWERRGTPATKPPAAQWWTLRNGNLMYGPDAFDHRQTLTMYGTYDLPMGRGKWLNISNPILDRVLGRMDHRQHEPDHLRRAGAVHWRPLYHEQPRRRWRRVPGQRTDDQPNPIRCLHDVHRQL